MRRVSIAALIVAAVLSPVVVEAVPRSFSRGALIGGWLWGGIAFAIAALAFGIGLALLVRWCRLHPEEAAGLSAAG